MNVLARHTQFADSYHDLLGALVQSPFVERNERTGREIKMIPGGCSFKVDLTSQQLPITETRRLFPHVAAAEVAWFLSGSRTTELLQRHNIKIWDKFLEEDGVTVAGAYGYRWRYAFCRDQIVDAIAALKDNPSDRRIWVQAWDPRVDGLGTPSKNVPCPVGFTFSLIDNILHSSIFLRSSDVFVGLPYDVMGHAMLMAAVASSLGAHALGTMHFTLAHAHLYEDHYEMARVCCLNPPVASHVPLMTRSVAQVRDDPDDFVWVYRRLARETAWHPFTPKPEVVA